MSERSWVDPTRYPYSKWMLARHHHASVEGLVERGSTTPKLEGDRRILQLLVELGWATISNVDPLTFTPLAPAFEACGWRRCDVKFGRDHQHDDDSCAALLADMNGVDA